MTESRKDNIVIGLMAILTYIIMIALLYFMI